MTARTYLVNGLVAGLVAGLLAFAVAFVVGEPPIDEAIAVEEAASAGVVEDEPATEQGHGTEVTRGQQAGPGLATALVIFGVVLGGITGIGAAFAAGRLGRLRPVGAVALVAGVGFVSYTLVPWVKYPPNPPAVGSEETLGERTALFFSFVSLSVLVAMFAVMLTARLIGRIGATNAAAVAVLVYVAVMVVGGLALPPIEEVPADFPASTLYDFRVSALLTQGTLWLGIGLLLSVLTARSQERTLAEARRRAEVAAL